ncbi:MAG TPA: FtsX-like permease family protein [Vicinamibacterales bacterium]|nr:FtsX-like permease family protein [Vicinamibacterales bacterium]
MDVPFELHVAIRYLLAKRKQAFISVISLISTLGVTVGVMAVVIALALMTGLQQELRDRILGSNAHVYVFKQSGVTDYKAEVEKMMNLPHVLGAAPAIHGMGLASVASKASAIQIKGIDPQLEPNVTDLGTAIKSGSVGAVRPAGPDDRDGILLGKDLASTLGVGVGDSISVLTPQGTLSPMGMLPVPRRLRVAGTFSLGLYEFDSTYGFVALDTARRLVGTGDTNEYIQLRLDDIFAAPQVAKLIPQALGSDYIASDWTEMDKSLFAALALEKIAVSLAIGLIVMVAALNIVASLILLVMEKNRDIAILKTMGATAKSVTLIFMMQGLIIGLIGTTAGAIGGFTIARILDRYQLIRVPVDVYQVTHLPFTVLPLDFTLVILTAILICFFATIYPSRQAARLDPAQALRYE